MLAIIYHTQFFQVNGALINAIEYFLAAFEKNPAVKFILLDCTDYVYKSIISLIEERYFTYGIENYVDNIILLPFFKFIKLDISKSIVLDYKTVKKTKGFLKGKIFCIVDLTNHRYDDAEHYAEMPWQKPGIDYKLKFLFHRYKNITLEPNVMVNCRLNYNNFCKGVDEIFYAEKYPELIDKSFIMRKNKITNYLSKFDTLLYITTEHYSAITPRCFHEAKFYGKRIIYVNNFNRFDGAYWRFNEVLSSGIEDRDIREDIIIEKLIQ